MTMQTPMTAVIIRRYKGEMWWGIMCVRVSKYAGTVTWQADKLLPAIYPHHGIGQRQPFSIFSVNIDI
jgi:hypothetical protein